MLTLYMQSTMGQFFNSKGLPSRSPIEWSSARPAALASRGPYVVAMCAEDARIVVNRCSSSFTCHFYEVLLAYRFAPGNSFHHADLFSIIDQKAKQDIPFEVAPSILSA